MASLEPGRRGHRWGCAHDGWLNEAAIRRSRHRADWDLERHGPLQEIDRGARPNDLASRTASPVSILETTLLATDDAHAINLAYERTQAGTRSRRPCRPVSPPAWLSRALTLPVIVNSEMGADTPAPRGQVPRRWGTALVDPDPGHDHLSGARLTLGIEGSPLPAAVGVGGSAGCRWERPDAAWPGRRLGAARSRRGAAGSRPSRRSRPRPRLGRRDRQDRDGGPRR
jgi:hypothetical protein